MNKIEEYAVRIIADYAQAGVEDEMDEDEEFEYDESGVSPDFDQAIRLAHAIIRGMRINPARLLALARPLAEPVDIRTG
jgi:hypothetical protein